MTTYILKKLRCSDFMGWTGEINFLPGRNVIIGQNGAGKTRIANAIYFGLYGKNAEDKQPGNSFEIKSIQDGETVHDVDYSVFQEWDIDGETLTIERIYKEKWTNKRKKVDQEMSGHEVEYRLNGDAKTTKRQFEDKINEVFGNKFRLCSDLFALQNIPWEPKKANTMNRRREILTDNFGDCDKDSIIDSIEGMRKFLNGRTPEEARKLADEKKTAINKEIKEIPISIKECKRQIDAATNDNCSSDEAVKALSDAISKQSTAKAAIDDFKSGNSGEIERLRELNNKLSIAESEFSKLKNEASHAWNNHLQHIKGIEFSIDSEKEIIKSTKTKIENLRKEWFSIDSEKFNGEGSCPLTSEFCQIALDKGEQGFNISRSDRLEENNKKGASLSEQIKKSTATLAELENKKAELEKEPVPGVLVLVKNDEIQRLESEIETLKSSMGEQREIPEEMTIALEMAEKEVERAREVKAAFSALEDTQNRIVELETRKGELGKMNTEIEKFIDMHELYMEQVASLTEGQVNERFEKVKFRMFDRQVNGTLIPACDIMSKDGKPLDGALSMGEGLTLGIDIVKTFQNHFDIQATTIIDEASELTIIPGLICQTIELHHARHEPKIAQAHAMHKLLLTYISEETFSGLSSEKQKEYSILW